MSGYIASRLDNRSAYGPHETCMSSRPSRDQHARQFAAPGAVRQPDRHHDRVLRFLHLCHRGGAGFSQAVLSRIRPGLGHARIAGHLWHRVPGAAGRLRALRSLWRSHRPQDHPGHRAVDHGLIHGRHRGAADLPHDWLCRAAAAGAVPLWPGAGSGRRVGRSGAAGH